jgi:3' terminal RNA ribose 2'-O-methyltransferase Hen1
MVGQAIPLQAEIAALPCRGNGELIGRLFEPLGYAVTTRRYTLDERFPDWGESRYWDVTLAGELPLQQLLRHLYVLIPALDDDKHYWVSQDEVEKLLRHGEAWLAAHPERELVADRYLRHQYRLTRDALARLLEDEAADPDEKEEVELQEEETAERAIGLGEQRIGAVIATLLAAGARRVVDLGCGEGRLLRRLAAEPAFTHVAGMEVSVGRLEMARERLRRERLPAGRAEQVQLLHGSLTYRDRRLEGFDAAAVVEVIEHLDPPRLTAFEQALFGAASLKTIVLTTPNVEYNVRFPDLSNGRFRHRDHRFEWTRAELTAWADGVAARYGYTPRFLSIGSEDPEVGSPTQMVVFARTEVDDAAHDS